jgi:hypothetical protein
MTKTKLKPQPGSHKVSTELHHLAANQPATTPREAELPKSVERDARIKRPLNSNRTGGPRTSEGRARSSLNAIKHGGYVTAKTAGLGYLQILDELTQRINPIGAVEETVVESLAVELFRLSMLGKLEVERLQSAVSAEVSALELAQALDYPWTQTHPDELRNPPRRSTLRARLRSYFSAHLLSLKAKSGPNPSQVDLQTIEALRLAVEDICAPGADGNDEDAEVPSDSHLDPAYLDDLDRYMHDVAGGDYLLGQDMALPTDVQPLVDYWLLRNYHRIEAKRRELQVAQMVLVLTNDGVRRARSHAMRQLDDCMHLLEILQGVPLDLGETSRDKLATQRKKARLSR